MICCYDVAFRATPELEQARKIFGWHDLFWAVDHGHGV